MIQGNFPPNHTPNQDLNLNNVDQTGCINTNRPITASLLDILAVGPVKSEVLTRNQMVISTPFQCNRVSYQLKKT